ncbi:conserved hypothetical protein [Talaromyces stipitatus ATCC 10500]|uniref:Uncharacterized protein n=1 Tax=Talaromyces stipitatus (strain ATCC 10500 / CBS 375.48 / QM 6759 / NRRL 1006) TaxID=441959 RepID=B8MH14_TALSN|nr:uncharacterized protein TSTA_018940 [Talaromyces stipitatus ATCC 10500]EED16828.1 conserved hypothetical protein [Talaromyces stipitatus ATCC 10500]
MYLPNSKWTWLFVMTAVIQAAVILGLEAYVFADFQLHLHSFSDSASSSKTIPTFLSLYIFGFVYELILVYDALRLKNTIQIIGLCFCNIGLLIYGGLQIEQATQEENLWRQTKGIMIAIPCIIAFSSTFLIFVAWKLYDEFAWTIYKHISADLRMKRRYLTYQIYIALLKFDFFFFLGFTVQFVVIVTGKTDVEFALTLAAIPVTILILFFAAYFTRRENTLGMCAVILLYFGGLAYFLFKLVRMYQPSRAPEYIAARRSLTFFAVITILLILATIANAIACTINFHKGLKPHVMRPRKSTDDEKATELGTRVPGEGVPSRMMID